MSLLPPPACWTWCAAWVCLVKALIRVCTLLRCVVPSFFISSSLSFFSAASAGGKICSADKVSRARKSVMKPGTGLVIFCRAAARLVSDVPAAAARLTPGFVPAVLLRLGRAATAVSAARACPCWLWTADWAVLALVAARVVRLAGAASSLAAAALAAARCSAVGTVATPAAALTLLPAWEC